MQLFNSNTCGSSAISSLKTFSGSTVDVVANTLTSGQSYGVYAKHTKNSTSKCSAFGIAYQYGTTPPQNPPTPPSLQEPTLVLKTGGTLTPTFTVTVDGSYPNGTVALFDGAGCSTTSIGSATVSGSTVDVTTNTLTYGQSYNIYAKHTTTGNESACSASGVNYQRNSLQQPVIALSSPSSSPGTDNTPTFQVTVDSGYTSGSVQLFSDSACSTTSVSDVANVSSTTVLVTVTTVFTHGQSRTVYAKHTDGSQDACSAGVAYRYEAALTAPTIALQSPSSSPGTDSTPTFRVTVDGNYTSGSVQLFSNSSCSTSLSGQVNFTGATADVVPHTPLASGQSYTVYAKHVVGRQECVFLK